MSKHYDILGIYVKHEAEFTGVVEKNVSKKISDLRSKMCG